MGISAYTLGALVRLFLLFHAVIHTEQWVTEVCEARFVYGLNCKQMICRKNLRR